MLLYYVLVFVSILNPAHPTRNEETFMKVPQLISHFGYMFEEHYVTTEDGYILTVHRIPVGRDVTFNRKGFVLADAGFDVWMANTRGNEYGKNHSYLSVGDKAFWNFTWYHHSRYDLKNTVEYVINATKQEDIYYYAVRMLSGVPLDVPHFLKKYFAGFCSVNVMSKVCNVFLTLVGMGTEQLTQFNNVITTSLPLHFESRWDVVAGHLPSASSALNLLHWAQVLRFHELRKFDYGEARNIDVYGQKQPPLFNLTRITTPMFMFWSSDDTLAPDTDVREHIIKKLGNALKGSFALAHFTHIDFILGLRATEDVYKPIVRLIYNDLAERANIVGNSPPAQNHYSEVRMDKRHDEELCDYTGDVLP
ncbi:hypothetical protein ANCCEY_05774 [Ancylostoma ceylanicum]|uniref:Partial AB-hydrolase lipase domain-containing protein n=1 Tax=Ancylostoma ceylanicum TaxID=53326 RepID=A0A0D6LVD2_9BILA|nr:hypothetical protein ANCCEY_05774 [Ancylostoma ceylanicum]